MGSPFLHALMLSAVLLVGSPQMIAAEADTSTSSANTAAHHQHHHQHRGAQFRKDIHVLLYDHGHDSPNRLEDDPASSIHFVKERSAISKIRTTVYGGRLKKHGSGDKLRLLKPFLEVANPAELIVVANAREVILNIPDKEDEATKAVEAFLGKFRALAEEHPNAVVLSAEEGCCSDAMGHASPGDYFDTATKERKHRACQPGDEGCVLGASETTDDNIATWKEAMLALALDQTSPSGYEESETVYLNSGILAGYPKDLMELLRLSNIEANEDDRAVLTDLMLAFPDKIILDYRQDLFGTNPVRKGLKEGCRFERQDDSKNSAIEPLVHSEQRTVPFLLHTPWRFYDCLDVLIDGLGGTSQQRYLQEYADGQEGIDQRYLQFTEVVEYPEIYDTGFDNNYGYGVLYGNYGQYGNYGLLQFFNKLLLLPTGLFGNYGNYGNYGLVAYGQYGYMESNYGNQYGNYGAFGYMATIIGEYISVPNYGHFLNFYSNYGNYGQYGNYGNYGNYGQIEQDAVNSVVDARTNLVPRTNPSTPEPTPEPSSEDFASGDNEVDEPQYTSIWERVWQWATSFNGGTRR